ncbi:leucine-rich melanocyte differentiation-associated protein-like isoform X2 [Haliotis rubra]|uniref:leucine-rich melanocyte differentiation-associated protein-like isoform X2 n=1 Tax=Haliotis rubra TaxID=36100 RepID=UPI001EE5CA8E|nr:leucine-rich melanocyte differentiation-associated protein-like isoform X2 [Haliotis rubra]
MADVNGEQVPTENNEDVVEPEIKESTHYMFEDGQLSCLGQDVEEIPQAAIDDYAKVTRRLDLSFNRLQRLDGLEHFSGLEELVLDNNELNDNMKFPKLSSLHTLTVNKNKITNLDGLLDNLKSQLPQLTYLSLLGNTACPNQLSCSDKDEEDYQRYRFFVLYQLPGLKFLDSTAVKSSEITEAERVGPFMRVVRLQNSQELGSSSPDDDQSGYTPLPQKARDPDQHAGTFGKSKYIYYGRHSEGNRFIRNNDL